MKIEPNKMKNILTLLLVTITISFSSLAQNQKVYNPEADATEEIKKAISLAKSNKQHVFLQIGGNWCPWCIQFHNFIEADSDIKDYLHQNYQVVKVNYDTDNKQEKVLSELEYPQRFGFPVFVVLNSNGKRIHTQNSAFLEKDKSYDSKTVLRFLKNWAPAAINPESYKK